MSEDMQYRLMMADIEKYRIALSNAEKAFQYMADFFPHCCEDCPCDEFRNKSEQQLVEIRSVMGKA